MVKLAFAKATSRISYLPIDGVNRELEVPAFIRFWKTSRGRRSVGRRRRATAAVELSVTLPFLLFMLAVAVDVARVFFHAQVITTCAWNGATYAANADLADKLSYATAEEAALDGAESLSPPPTVIVEYSTDATDQSVVDVTVDWTFKPILHLPGFPINIPVQRTSRMRMHPEGTEDSP